MEPKQFGKYTLLERVGKGGVGTVYRARQGEAGEIVAVKVFQCTPQRSLDMTRRLRNREVRMLMSVQHPNIVQFRETGEVGDDHYYTMEFVEHSLLERMRNGNGLKLLDKVHLLRQTASALAAVHRQAIVHRDVKPGNILLGVEPGGTLHAKLTDLGIAINVSETDIIQEQRRGAIPGTPKYMSPEQVRQEHLDGRSDVFSLGVLAYELLTGRLPFKADTAEEFMAANTEQTAVPPVELVPDFPVYLSKMVARMLARDREERYDSDTLARDLQLVEQHLVSGAPLIERTNAGSVFYEAAPTAPARRRRRLPRIAPLSYALAVGILLGGAAVTWFGRAGAAQPAAPAAPTAAKDDGPPAILQAARTSAASGRYYEAALALRSIERAGLPPDAARSYDDLSTAVQEGLASRDYAAATLMLKEKRDAEAAVILAHMKDAYPASPLTGKLDAALAALQQQATDAQRFENAMAHTYALVGRRQYADALAQRRKLLQEFASDPTRRQQARRAISDLLASWAGYLQQSNAGIDRIREYLSTLDENAPFPLPDSLAQAAGALHLLLGRRYQAATQYARALEQYELAGNMGGADTRKAADGAYKQLNARMMDMPLEAAAFAADVKRHGLASDYWQAHEDRRGRQSLAGGVLTMRIAAGRGACSVTRRTMRPLRNLGFSASVQLKVLQAQEGARAGLSVIDSGGNGIELYFDGAGYGLTRRARGTAISSRLRGPIGDEKTAWHTLSLRYAFDTGRLAVLLDGRTLQQQSLDLSDVRLGLFLDTTAASADEAQFRRFAYSP